MEDLRNFSEEELLALGIEGRYGVEVRAFTADSPAQKAGIEKFDILLEFDGEKIDSSKGLQQQVLKKQIGQQVGIKVFRPSENRERTFAIALTEQPDDFFEASAPVMRLGMKLQPVSAQLAREHNLEIAEGLWVTEVLPGGEAEKEQIHPGDIVREAQWVKIGSVSQLDTVLDGLKAERKTMVILKVLRNSTEFQAFLNLNGDE